MNPLSLHVTWEICVHAWEWTQFSLEPYQWCPSLNTLCFSTNTLLRQSLGILKVFINLWRAITNYWCGITCISRCLSSGGSGCGVHLEQDRASGLCTSSSCPVAVTSRGREGVLLLCWIVIPHMSLDCLSSAVKVRWCQTSFGTLQVET